MLRTLVLALVWLLPATASAQFIAGNAPGQEQQEFATVLLLGPEGTVLGAFLVGGGAYLVTKDCCTKKGEDVSITPVAIGAAVGGAIGTSISVWSVGKHFHPGSRLNCAIGATVGSAVGAAFYFGGPGSGETSSDEVLRLVSFLFLPSVGGWAGWHVEPYGGTDWGSAHPPPVWADHIGPAEISPYADPPVTTVGFRF
jgi:hypothetical protein